MKRIELDVSLETKDFWRYYLGYYFSFSSVFYFYLSFTIFGFCIAFLLYGKYLEFQHFVQVGMAAALFVCLFNFVMSYFSVENAKRLDSGKCKYIFSDEKTEISTEFFKSQTDWRYISSVKETTNYFVLPMKDGQSHLIPKRFFRDYEQIASFKNLLRVKFGDKAALKKSKENLGLK